MKKYKPTTKEELQKLVRNHDIYLGDIDTSLITDMSYLFCKDLGELDGMIDEDFDGSAFELGQTFMKNMLEDMDKSRRDFSGINEWDTSNVVDMNNMFFNCKYFNESLSFNTCNVRDMSLMFYGCENFNQTLNLDTRNVINMSYMFCGCVNFNQKLNFDTSSVKDMDGMFEGCESLEHKSDFASKFEKQFDMFEGCVKLKDN